MKTINVNETLAQLKGLPGYASHTTDTRLEAWGLYNAIHYELCRNGLAGQGSEGLRLIEEANMTARIKSLGWYLAMAGVMTGGGCHGEADLFRKAKTLDEHVEGAIALVEGAAKRTRGVTFSKDVFSHYVGEERELPMAMKAYLMEVYQDHIRYVRGGYSSYAALCGLARNLREAVENGITTWTELGITPEEVQAGLDRQMRQDALFCVLRLLVLDDQDEQANGRPEELDTFIREARDKGVVSRGEIDSLYKKGSEITRKDVCAILGYQI